MKRRREGSLAGRIRIDQTEKGSGVSTAQTAKRGRFGGAQNVSTFEYDALNRQTTEKWHWGVNLVYTARMVYHAEQLVLACDEDPSSLPISSYARGYDLWARWSRSTIGARQENKDSRPI